MEYSRCNIQLNHHTGVVLVTSLCNLLTITTPCPVSSKAQGVTPAQARCCPGVCSVCRWGFVFSQHSMILFSVGLIRSHVLLPGSGLADSGRLLCSSHEFEGEVTEPVTLAAGPAADLLPRHSGVVPAATAAR